ncbi:tRNA A64-2'-O-ribosylphosphate transferase [Gnomoniopsis sp. IMI 355080]|nr:tRNA A64-2'-O-ribosylphosphate transferase [Gnomoniopsis sp. IMI 355080]
MSSLSNILFPSQQSSLDNGNNINRILGDLKRSNLSITNRLRSIQQDADFVEQVAAAFGGARPLVANERCGSWYIRPERKGASAYFKSTDGHTGMPDALSKTIPMWCCIINRALFPDQPESHGLYVPPNAVSDSEKSQMLARIPEGLDGLMSLSLDLASLRMQISKPVRPTWVTQETDLSHYDREDSQRIFEQYRPVICCTSSRRVVDGEVSGRTGYIQGAGDDTENWAHGLEPTVFWEHNEQLLSTAEPDLRELIQSLVQSAKRPPLVTMTSGSTLSLPPAARHLTAQLTVCPLPLPPSLPADSAWCTIAISSMITPAETWAKAPTRLEVGLGKHKAASRNLRVALANICRFATQYLHTSATPTLETSKPKRILIACETGGKDLAVGVALALLCWCFEDDAGAVLRRMDGGQSIEDATEMMGFNKTMIKVRLGRIMTAMPEANPNRATLQSVNSFLMDWRK